MRVSQHVRCRALRSSAIAARPRRQRTQADFVCRSAPLTADLPALDTTYAALATLLTMFGLTFGVAPQFKSSFKEPDAWKDIYAQLKDMGGVEAIEPAEAVRRVRRGARLVDVRLNRKFVEGAMEDSENLPLYQPISGWSIPANIRRAGFAFFGIYGTERNEEWLQSVEREIPKSTEVILACDMGGSLDCKPGASTGFQSQSLKAAYYLKKAGYKKVSYLRGGVDEYKRAVGPVKAVTQPAPVSEKVSA